jgi:hypothetical protein
VWGATCTTPVVDTDVRAHGIRLLRAFAAQPGASFLYARPATQALATAWRSLAFEVDGHLSDGAVLHWPLGRTSIRATRMGSRPLCHLPNWVRRLAGSDPAEPSHSRSCGLRIQRLSADELAGTCPGPWPQIWNAWANRFWSWPGLWTERSAYLMSWRLADPDMAGRLGLWVVHDGAATMLGMALARLRPAEEQGSASAELLDWALLPQAPAACSQLLLDAVKHWALSGHACSLEAAGFSGEAAQQLHALAPQHLEHDVGELLVLQTPQDMSVEALQAEAGERPLLPPWNSTGCEHADWFYTGSTKTPELTSTWHPARAARVYPAPRPPDRAPVVTNSACASR